jgi:hypothetical protein
MTNELAKLKSDLHDAHHYIGVLMMELHRASLAMDEAEVTRDAVAKRIKADEAKLDLLRKELSTAELHITLLVNQIGHSEECLQHAASTGESYCIAKCADNRKLLHEKVWRARHDANWIVCECEEHAL